MPERFSTTQIVLHWGVALLVLAQFLNDSAIGRAWRAEMRGTAEAAPGFAAMAHIVAGVVILALVVWRIGLRLTRGAPPAPAAEPRGLRILAATTHGALYVLLLLLPVSGLVAWFGLVGPAGEAHEAMKTALLALVLMHLAGALYQQFVLRTDVLARMTRPGG